MLFLFLLFFRGLVWNGESTAVKPEVWLSSGPSPGPGHLRLVCHVSGFHPKPVWVMWMRGGHSILITLLCLTVIVALVMVILHACWRKQSSNQSVHSPHMSNSAFPTETKAQDPRDPTHQLYLAQESWIKNRILAWKRSLNQCW
ncbi:T-cell surface glycoprotein CD1e, membrane-associated isoform X5 [Perognathus longimembris pacificus]|uniref:T-cell surface glycoprotein CD1e, membrane-associated isoform X5 n=1 Tax=Perognathus longimembris pacificus TaxID=214514 RepID=UPI00201A0A4D|nr:T-cell surface glycoprotein CD1e, membrane-associated isoform X5 [Perognathus longimembris pacificus]